MTMRKTKNDFHTIQSDLNKLSNDISKIWDHMVDYGRDHAVAKKDELRDQLKDKFQHIKDNIYSLKEKGSEFLESPSQFVGDTEEKIEQNPWVSVGIAFGIGIVFGTLIDRLNRE